ncbi:Subtilase family protein [Streptomyces sp. OV198]|uniref:S8 family serine peptidase n=1 Tax=Streptomyces sp. OV198 TaxID=1882787 RepID=UPI000BD2B3B6|nr:S8 family serine peptidase [Streptomyces sp. OV198]SOF02265.1 Subtilase family protein [Streptomyces sp. OV198]
MLLGVGTLAGLLVAPADAADHAPAGEGSQTTPAGSIEKITLITGDTVRYRRTGDTVEVISSTPAAQRPQMAFGRYTENGHEYVIPQDAWGAVARGQVDKELFDITALVAQKLDDRHTDRIGVIVTGKAGTAPKAAAPSTAKATRTMPRLGARAWSTAKSDAASLWAGLTNEKGDTATNGRRAVPAPHTKIWLDGVVHSTLDVSVPLIGAPAAWQHGYTGEGVKVAVLDTGIDSAHPDLAGKIEAAKNFSDAADTEDHVGHGTHVASTITGSGAASGGRYRGVAPGVRLLNGKVLNDEGSGYDSSILAGMEWAVQQGAKVINMSLGGDAPGDGHDLMSTEVNWLSADSGALFAIAAGNAGGDQTVSSPGAADAALTVASTTKQDALSSFSSRGPRLGDFGLKPDIAAPGQDIVAARAPGAFPQQPGGSDYVSLSGTSMATPHVAGAAAIVAGEHPDWTGEQIKAALMGSATVLNGIGVFGDGAGRLDVARATAQNIHALTPSLSFGRIAWPHDPAKPTTMQVNYANDGDTPVTLDLSLSVTDLTGKPAPAGLFSAEPSLTVPAHSSASTTVRLAAGPESTGSFQGRLTATAGDTRLVTPLAAQVREQTHTVTLNVLGRSGEALGPDDGLIVLQNDATGAQYPATDSADTIKAEVPEGTYRVLGLGVSPEHNGWSTAHFALDGLRVDRDRTVLLDSREAQPVTASVDDPAARPDAYSAFVTTQSIVASDDASSELDLTSNYRRQYVLSAKAIPGVTLSYSASWAPPQNRVTTLGSHPFEVGDVQDPQTAGYKGDVTGQLKDIGKETDPDRIGDVSGKVILIAPDFTDDPAEPPTQDQYRTLVAELKARGAKLVLSDGTVRFTDILPVLYVLWPEDIQGLRDSAAAGKRVHVVGKPASPTQYAIFNAVGAGLPHGQAWHFDKARMAREDTTYRSAAGGRLRGAEILLSHDPVTGLSNAMEQGFVFPQSRVKYFTPGVSWMEFTDEGVNADGTYTTSEVSSATTYRARQRTRSAWSSAPFGPRLPQAPTSRQDGKPVPVVYRDGDRLVTHVPVFNSANPLHTTAPTVDENFANLEHGTTELFESGKKVGGSDTPGVADLTVPAEPGTYRLVTTGTRPSILSPAVRSEWTFTTGHTEDGVRTPLDLLDLGFVLPLDGYNKASAGKKLTGTVTVRHQPGSAGTSPVRAVRVDVSYDDGKSWRHATIKDTGHGTWSVSLPKGGRPGGFATLRASAVDKAGSRVRQTITRAYGLR